MHFIQARSILSAQNGMNLYRGCQHGCIYCDARSRCYHMDHRFEDVAVKENAIELLSDTLRRRRRPCMIATGSMSDPYTPIEQTLGLTRKALEVIEENGCGVTLLTKSDLMLRDLDILARINEKTKAVVQVTLTTANDSLCRLIEPNAALTSRRIAMLHACRERGIPTAVWLCPLLPGLNDTPENLRFLLGQCREAGVRGVVNFGMGLTLREGSREYFYAQLDRKFPGLKEHYIRTYGNAYILNSPRERELTALFHRLCGKYGMMHDNDQIFRWLSSLDDGQLSFFRQEAL